MQITARLSADATVKTLPDERKVVTFSVAINDSYKPKGSDQSVKAVTYFDCSYWSNPAIVSYLKKGSIVELSGRITIVPYLNKSGEPKAAIRFHVNLIKLHGGGYSSSNPSSNTSQPANAHNLTEPLDDLPF